jgi:DNA-binding winged helix-turn-helix (wHTH) protein
VEVLLILVENHGELVARQDLIGAVWPDTFVEKSNLSSNISILRRQLGATPDGGSYIQTIPKRGYRFVAAVKEVQNQPSTLPSEREVRAGAGSASVEEVKSNQAIQQAELGEASNSGSAGGWDWKETGRADGSHLCSRAPGSRAPGVGASSVVSGA